MPQKLPFRPPYSAFIDRAHAPSPIRVRQVLARASAAWDDLEEHLVKTYGLERSIHFMYGERYGWALRFHRGGRLALAMYPNQGRLTAQIILGPAHLAAAIAMDLPSHASTALEAAKPYPEGRWLFIPVTSLASARQLRPLIALKMSRPRDGGVTGHAEGSGPGRRTSAYGRRRQARRRDCS